MDPLTREQVNKLEMLDRKLQEDPFICEIHINTSEELVFLEDGLKRYKDDLVKKSRTAKFWLQHLHYIDVLVVHLCRKIRKLGTASKNSKHDS